MSIAEDLRLANQTLEELILPHIKSYEKETGLAVESISIRRLILRIGQRVADIDGIEVRTNADTL